MVDRSEKYLPYVFHIMYFIYCKILRIYFFYAIWGESFVILIRFIYKQPTSKIKSKHIPQSNYSPYIRFTAFITNCFTNYICDFNLVFIPKFNKFFKMHWFCNYIIYHTDLNKPKPQYRFFTLTLSFKTNRIGIICCTLYKLNAITAWIYVGAHFNSTIHLKAFEISLLSI